MPAKVDASYWLRLAAVFRAQPPPGGNISAAARTMKADRATVRRLWSTGVPGTAWGSRPMRDVVGDEITKAAAAREGAAAYERQAQAVAVAASLPVPSPAERHDARADAIAARAEEARLIRAARANVLALFQITTNVAKGALELSKKIERAIRDAGTDGSPPISAPQALLILTRTANLTQKVVSGAAHLIEMERHVLGDPSVRAGEAGSLEADDMTPEEAIAELEQAAKVAARMQALGLRVIEGEGGAAGPPAPATPDGPAATAPGQSDAHQPAPPDPSTTAPTPNPEVPHGNDPDPKPQP